MTPTVIFTISGLGIAILLAAKGWGEKRRKHLLIFKAISKGDTHIREFHHHSVRWYSEGKDKGLFFFKKQVPMHSRNSLYKLLNYLKEKRDQYLNNMRDSKLLKKSDGISEFFKSISNNEKEKGEINDVFEDGSQEDKKELE